MPRFNLLLLLSPSFIFPTATPVPPTVAVSLLLAQFPPTTGYLLLQSFLPSPQRDLPSASAVLLAFPAVVPNVHGSINMPITVIS